VAFALAPATVAERSEAFLAVVGAHPIRPDAAEAHVVLQSCT
jgi:hypothetical protein